jgi:hypothetical protein
MKKTLLYLAAGVVAAMVAKEVPAMVRYYKMRRM